MNFNLERHSRSLRVFNGLSVNALKEDFATNYISYNNVAFEEIDSNALPGITIL